MAVHRNYMTGAYTLNIYLAFCPCPILLPPPPPDFLLFQNSNKIQPVDLDSEENAQD